jgi:phosphatidylethanolamine/phosphatidyl-N-methylethanolamine N-methyltransferase
MGDGTNGNGVRDSVLIFRRFLKNPRTIGAVMPSGRALAQVMVANLPERTPARIVELGPGTGAFTGAIVDRVGNAGRFLAIDIEPEFVREIHLRFPRVECVQASAEQLESLVKSRNLAPVDHILSGLPFGSLPLDMTDRILEGIEKSLRPGGTFTAFQYVHAYRLARSKRFRRDMSRRMGASPVTRLVTRNFPPAFVMSWTRGGAETERPKG